VCASAKGGKGVVLLAIVVFAVLMGGYYLIEYKFLLDGELLKKYLAVIASSTAWVLDLFGYECIVRERWIFSLSHAAALEIVHGCDALEPTMAFLAAVLASPVAFRRKIPGLLVGIPALLLINIGRIVTLFLIKAHKPDLLDVMHYDVWQAMFIVLAILAWAIWVQWATRVRAVQGDDSVQGTG